jgi:hypothetical protein
MQDVDEDSVSPLPSPSTLLPDARSISQVVQDAMASTARQTPPSPGAHPPLSL